MSAVDDYQPRYVAYVRHEGRTPAEQHAHDRRADGSFRGHEFMLWVRQAWRAWAESVGRRHIDDLRESRLAEVVQR